MHTRDVREYDYISRELLQLLEYNYIEARQHQLVLDNARPAPRHRLMAAPALLRLPCAVTTSSRDRTNSLSTTSSTTPSLIDGRLENVSVRRITVFWRPTKTDGGSTYLG
jgi:hypothetical protein